MFDASSELALNFFFTECKKMKVSKLIDAWGVPLIIAIGALLFWFHIQDAPAVAARMPNFVLIFIVFMLWLVVRRTFKKQMEQKIARSDTAIVDELEHDELVSRKQSPALDFLRRQSVPIFFGLGFIYFLTFEILGFSISNFIFIFTSMIVVKNYQADFSLKHLPAVLATALITTGLLYIFAKLTSFNIPSGIFGI